ncbi:hypothetical protein DPEC_G00141050 [Dallia pectoralis]|uniref:Uncharacterized protein n=1 Tax=Dallia pectoralis TaxID=75939 RepID=A0ACC2GN49_DALPE|nr:hypothetical protein DPEC_G00141050 [Dallia pectoralis]
MFFFPTACSQGQAVCPAYPTELVFALDMSRDVEPSKFQAMRSSLLSLLEHVTIAESNCPTGARVAVVSYSDKVKYLIRFQDYQRKQELLEAVRGIALEKTSNKRYLGAAMRFVGRHVFKRTRQALTLRKVAVFFINGPSEDTNAIITAAMEYKALGITSAAISTKNVPDIRKVFEECQLTTYIRDNCGRAVCPAYPTELVFALDMSRDVEPSKFQAIRSSLLSLLEHVTIAESNCPTGARVAVVSYSDKVKYLIRFQDFQRKQELLEAIRGIALEKTSSLRYLGAAMRFVGRHVFKRTRQALTLRKVAVFFTNGPSEDTNTIITAAMEYKALGITSVAISTRNVPAIQKVFEVDNTGSFFFGLLMNRMKEDNNMLHKINKCVICYDHCKPDSECKFTDTEQPHRGDMDLALVVDGSREIQADQYTGFQELIGSIVKQVALSPKPNTADGQARVALVQTGGSHLQMEFDLQKYRDHKDLEMHLKSKMQQHGGVLSLGRTLEYIVDKVLLKAQMPRKSRVVLTVVGAETAHSDQAKLAYISQKAKCQGISLFVITVGDHFNITQAEKIASMPLEQHLLHLRQVKELERGYAQRFFRFFLRVLSKGFNHYPPAQQKRTCELMLGQEHGGRQKHGGGQTEVVTKEEEHARKHTWEHSWEHTEEYTEEYQKHPADHTSHWKTDESTLNDRDACFLRQDVGGCRNYTVKWYFDTKQHECSRFWYGGCGGNGNRFETQEACEGLCLRMKR